MAIAPAAISARPAVTTTAVDATASDSPAVSAKGTVRPSDMPITRSRTTSAARKCRSMCGVVGISPPPGGVCYPRSQHDRGRAHYHGHRRRRARRRRRRRRAPVVGPRARTRGALRRGAHVHAARRPRRHRGPALDRRRRGPGRRPPRGRRRARGGRVRGREPARRRRHDGGRGAGGARGGVRGRHRRARAGERDRRRYRPAAGREVAPPCAGRLGRRRRHARGRTLRRDGGGCPAAAARGALRTARRRAATRAVALRALLLRPELPRLRRPPRGRPPARRRPRRPAGRPRLLDQRDPRVRAHEPRGARRRRLPRVRGDGGLGDDVRAHADRDRAPPPAARGRPRAYLAPPAAAGAAAALLGLPRLRPRGAGAATPPNPLQLRGALQTTIGFQLVLFAVHAVRTRWGSPGVLVTGALLGLTDVDALTVSMVKGAATGLPLAVAARATAAGALANTLLKLGLAATIGRGAFRGLVTSRLGLIGAAAVLALALA